MFEFKHPKYYAELRAEGRKLQASSDKPQAEESRPGRSEATSSKHQAPSDGELRAKAYAKLASRIVGKPQAPSIKRQADIKNHE